MCHSKSESGESQNGLEPLSHPHIGDSISLLPQDQDFGLAEGFDVGSALLGEVLARSSHIGSPMRMESEW
jgi:hypothetical protein